MTAVLQGVEDPVITGLKPIGQTRNQKGGYNISDGINLYVLMLKTG